MNKKLEEMAGVSLFCGAGGLDLGFEQEGFHVAWCNDMFEAACQTHKLWSKATVVRKDITKIDESEVPDADFMLFGFPCPGFSLAGPRRMDDPRNRLYLECVRMVRAKQPTFFVAENVKGLLSMGDGSVIRTVVSDFESCGYDVFYKLLNAADYGVPQDRQRVIIVGLHKGLGFDHEDAFSFPEPYDHKVTLRETIWGKPHQEGDVCREGFSSRYMSRNRKRGWDEVSFTIPASAKQVPLWSGSPDMKKVGPDLWEFGDDVLTRRLSWQECAAIQTFPPGFTFMGSISDVYKQIGNAVPVQLANEVAKSVKLALFGGMIV